MSQPYEKHSVNVFKSQELTLQEAKDLAILLRSGSLSAPMSIIEERTVGPSLGSENIISGRDSMILGMILVIAFMFIYYKTLVLLL